MKNKNIIKKWVFALSASISICIVPILILSCSKIGNNQLLPPINKPNDKPILPPNESKPEQKPPTDSTLDENFNNINDTYLKNNKINLIDNPSEYSISTPGTGGNNSIINNSAPSKTTPSDGVENNAKSDDRFIRTNLDIKQSKITFSLVFVDISGGTALGTGWILDFKLPSKNETYPKTWYIATNSHVIQNLKVNNDTISPERYNGPDNDYYDTQFVRLVGLKDQTLDKKLVETDQFNNDKTTYNYARIYPNDGANLKTIFIGNDFLKTTPSMFSRSGMWSDVEEYIDFAVMEVTFSSEEEAKKMTNDYYNDESLWFKYQKKSLVNEEEYIKKTKFNELGYPTANEREPRNQTSYLITNKNKDRNKNSKDSTLASSPYYRTFKNNSSSFDAALVLSYFGYNYRYADPEKNQSSISKRYASWGLMYQVNYGNLNAGSSGSMLLDENGYTWGIHLGADPNASLGFAQSLYCEGFNYQGKYGRYNLQGYDLINGGFPNQKTSYKDNLKKLYGNDPTFKTNLFKNGLSS